MNKKIQVKTKTITKTLVAVAVASAIGVTAVSGFASLRNVDGGRLWGGGSPAGYQAGYHVSPGYGIPGYGMPGYVSGYIYHKNFGQGIVDRIFEIFK